MRISAAVLGVLLAASWASAQTTQPAATAGGSGVPLQFRADQAFNQGRYVVALPLLQELAGNYYDQPDKRGPIEERINVCKKAIDAAKKQGPTDPSQLTPQPVSLSAGRHPHETPAPGEIVDMPIKELGNFDYDQQNGGNIPTDVLQLNGCQFRTRGYMIPLDQAENISEFALVPSLFSCCFGQPPQTQHTIVVHLPKGKAVNYFPDELEVTGTLRVEEKKDEGFIVSIFEIDATSVKVAAQ